MRELKDNTGVHEFSQMRNSLLHKETLFVFLIEKSVPEHRTQTMHEHTMDTVRSHPVVLYASASRSPRFADRPGVSNTLRMRRAKSAMVRACTADCRACASPAASRRTRTGVAGASTVHSAVL